MNQETQQIDTIAVCVVTNNNEIETQYFIENLIQKTNENCTLYIYDYQSKSKDFLNYLANISLQCAGRFKFITEETKLASIYNMFIENVTEKYIAFVSINTIFNSDWISELLYHYKNIHNSGCIGIRSQNDDVFLCSSLFYNILKDEDEMRTVWAKKLNVLDTPVFFEKAKIEEVGLVNDRLKNFGNEINEFSFRFKVKGFSNYFIRNTTCIKTFTDNQFLVPHKTRLGAKEFNKLINQMAEAENNYG
jgi:hypothetical protein